VKTSSFASSSLVYIGLDDAAPTLIDGLAALTPSKSLTRRLSTHCDMSANKNGTPELNNAETNVAIPKHQDLALMLLHRLILQRSLESH
jgi:hypothetical protein